MKILIFCRNCVHCSWCLHLEVHHNVVQCSVLHVKKIYLMRTGKLVGYVKTGNIAQKLNMRHTFIHYANDNYIKSLQESCLIDGRIVLCIPDGVLADSATGTSDLQLYTIASKLPAAFQRLSSLKAISLQTLVLRLESLKDTLPADAEWENFFPGEL